MYISGIRICVTKFRLPYHPEHDGLVRRMRSPQICLQQAWIKKGRLFFSCSALSLKCHSQKNVLPLIMLTVILIFAGFLILSFHQLGETFILP